MSPPPNFPAFLASPGKRQRVQGGGWATTLLRPQDLEMGGKEDAVPRSGRWGDRVLSVVLLCGVCWAHGDPPRRGSCGWPCRRAGAGALQGGLTPAAVSGQQLKKSVTGHKVDCPAWWRPPEVPEGRSSRQGHREVRASAVRFTGQPWGPQLSLKTHRPGGKVGARPGGWA